MKEFLIKMVRFDEVIKNNPKLIDISAEKLLHTINN